MNMADYYTPEHKHTQAWHTLVYRNTSTQTGSNLHPKTRSHVLTVRLPDSSQRQENTSTHTHPAGRIRSRRYGGGGGRAGEEIVDEAKTYDEEASLLHCRVAENPRVYFKKDLSLKSVRDGPLLEHVCSWSWTVLLTFTSNTLDSLFLFCLCSFTFLRSNLLLQLRQTQA